MPKLVIIQVNVSQLDEPVYAEIAARMGSDLHVIYWNDYGLQRTRKDAELGVVPQFRDTASLEFDRTWLDRSQTTWWDLFNKVTELAPDMVFLLDIGRVERAKLSAALRLGGVRTVLRSDKNSLSQTVRTGIARWQEKALNRLVFSGLAAVSPLTRDYYDWPEGSSLVYFPYSTRRSKFAPPAEDRASRAHGIREKLGISPNSKVVVSAAKFAERENPWCIFKAFEIAAEGRPDLVLIGLGDGPLMGEIRAYCDERQLPVHLPGYVDFASLQDYFFAGQIFVHFPRYEPWGVSLQDALVAGMGVVAGDTVGSAQCILSGEERRFLVDIDDPLSCANRLGDLADLPDPAAPFARAHARAGDFCSDHVAEDIVAFVTRG